jgi:hypothetical protein
VLEHSHHRTAFIIVLGRYLGVDTALLSNIVSGVAVGETMTTIEHTTIGVRCVDSGHGSIVGQRGIACRAHVSLLVLSYTHTGDCTVPSSEASGSLTRVEEEAFVRDIAEGVGVVEVEDRLSEDVEDTEDNHFLEWGDDFSTVGNTPYDGVEEPEKNGFGSRITRVQTHQPVSVSLSSSLVSLAFHDCSE